MKHNLLFTAFTFLFFQFALAQNYVLDNTFGNGGKVITSFGPAANVNLSSIIIQTDGKIIASASYSDGSITELGESINRKVLSRYNVDGSLDNTFGTNGIVFTPLVTNVENEYNAVRVLNNGKILVAGTSGTSSTSFDFAVVQYNTDGSLDINFGVNGILLSDFSNESKLASLEIQKDNKIVVGGSIAIPSSGNFPNFAIARYNPDGTKDISFGVNGLANINIGTVSNSLTVSEDYISALKIQSDGKIVACGLTNVNNLTGGGNFGLVRLNTDGSLDGSFGNNGRVITDFGETEEANSIQILSDGKIILSGIYYFNKYENAKVVVAKYKSDGTLDTTYGNNGKVITDFGNPLSEALAFSSQMQADGKLLLVGFILNTTYDLLIVRYNNDGSLDNTFDADGFLFLNFGKNEGAFSSIFQIDGKLLLGGGAGNGSTTDFMLLRLKTDNLSTETFENSKYYISPNPFTNSITITTKDSNLSIASIEMYDSSGRKIAIFPKEQSNNFTFSINNNLSKGTYFLKIADQQSTQTFKVMKE